MRPVTVLHRPSLPQESATRSFSNSNKSGEPENVFFSFSVLVQVDLGRVTEATVSLYQPDNGTTNRLINPRPTSMFNIQGRATEDHNSDLMLEN